MMIRPLLFSFLVCLSLVHVARAAEVGARPYDVLHYEAEVRPDIEAESVSGVVDVKLRSLVRGLAEARLDAVGIVVEDVSERGAPRQFVSDAGLLTVRFARALAAGEVRTLRIRYHATPTRGLRFFPDQFYAAYNTHHWLVCNFHPGDKATLRLTLIVPAELQVVGNGRLLGETRQPDGSKRSVWQQETPLPAYTFGFAAGRFQETTQQAGPLRLRFLADTYTPAQVARIFADTPDMFAFFTRRAGVAYAGPVYTQALVAGGVMQELGGFTLLRADYGAEVLAEPRENWLVAHELAHQWWGNNVTCADWSHFWLNEGMATFMTAAYKEQRFGRAEYERELALARRRYAQLRAAGQDRPLAFRQPVAEADAGGPLVYNKGALVLHLLRYELGERAFWAGLRRYTRAGFGRGVTSDDLRAAMEQASGQRLTDFFDHWVYGNTPPTLNARHRADGDKLFVELSQDTDKPWAFTVQVAVETARGRVTRRVLLSDRRAELAFHLPAPLLSVRVDDGGHLPLAFAHERPPAMLLYQLAHEPDTAGRIDALAALQSLCANRADPATCEHFKTGVQERIAQDPSRLVRALAERVQRDRQ
ncbi:MAG TPA: M1 family metallopeptidase [Pyrinomonadaceae bacterium]